MKHLLTTILISIAVVTFATGGGEGDTEEKGKSNEYHWGVDEKEAKVQWVALQSAVRKKEFNKALIPTHWLIQHTPDLNVNLYVYGAQVFEKTAKKEKDPIHKQHLQDSALLCYNKRIEFGEDRAYVLNREGRVAWKYLHKRPNQDESLYHLYEEIYELNHETMLASNATYYLRTALVEYKLKKLTKFEVFELYEELNSFLDQKLVAKAGDSKVKSIVAKERTKMEKSMDIIEMNCEDIIDFHGPKYEHNHTLEYATKINKQMRKVGACKTNDLFINTTKHMIAENPSADAYRELASIYYELYQENTTKTNFADSTYKALSTSIELESADSLKATSYYQLATLDKFRGRKAAARTNARLALKYNATLKEAHKLIGDLYLASASTSCKSGDFLVQKAVFIAAYDEYKLAGSATNMNNVKQYFPTKTEVFERSKEEGESITTGCWINETVRVEF